MFGKQVSGIAGQGMFISVCFLFFGDFLIFWGGFIEILVFFQVFRAKLLNL